MAYIGKNPKQNTSTFTPQSADPSSPTEGMVFYSDGTPRAEGLWQYQNSDWVAISATGSKNVTTETSAYTATASDDVILCDDTSASFTVTLPTAVGIIGKEYTFIKINSSSNEVTIDGDGSETINGNTTTTINTQYEKLTIISDGTNWYIEERNCNTAWVDSTGTLSNSTGVATQFYKERRVGDSMQYKGIVTWTGSGGGTNWTITLPRTVDTSKLLNSSANLLATAGTANWYNVSQNQSVAQTPYVVSSTTIRFLDFSDNSTLIWGAGEAASGDVFAWDITVPIDGWKAENE